jgi:hypothetical protein
MVHSLFVAGVVDLYEKEQPLIYPRIKRRGRRACSVTGHEEGVVPAKRETTAQATFVTEAKAKVALIMTVINESSEESEAHQPPAKRPRRQKSRQRKNCRA